MMKKWSLDNLSLELRKWLPTGFLAIVEESLDHILRTSFDNTQSGLRSVTYNVVEQVMLDQPRISEIVES